MRQRRRRWPWIGRWLLIVTCGSTVVATRSGPGTEADGDLARPHEARQVEGWTVHVDLRLLAQEALARDVLEVLGHSLFDVRLTLPEHVVQELREVPIWLDLDHPLRNLQYHPDAAWLEGHGYDPALAGCVHVPEAARYLALMQSNAQPSVILHELAHAYHHRKLGFEEPRILTAYDAAIQTGRYEQVLHVSGRPQRHYALTDAREYFAEGVEAFAGTNDFYPFVRAELREHDPELERLLREVFLQGAEGR